jgi:glycosyltransferase involved in cell wall biosynthesis
MELTTVIPVFNGERFLRTTLECLAAQSRRPDRVVVVDNGSTDGTPDLVRGFRDIPCEFHRNPSNLGVIGNLNRCLEFAAGTRFLHLLMADDLVGPEFFARLLPPLSEAPGRALGYSLHDEIDQDGRRLGPARSGPGGPARRIGLNEFLRGQSELRHVLLPGVVLKTEFLPAPCRFENMPQVADALFVAEWAAVSSAVVEVPEALSHFRIHPFSASVRHMHDADQFLRDEWRFMQRILPMFQEGPLCLALRRRRLACLFAARAQVKIDVMAHLDPVKAAEFSRVRGELVGPTARWAGTAVVRCRDLLRRLAGKPGRAHELMQSRGGTPGKPDPTQEPQGSTHRP